MLKSNFENLNIIDKATVISIKNVKDGVEIVMKHYSKKGIVKTIVTFAFEEYFTKTTDIPTPDPSVNLGDKNYQLFLGMTENLLMDTVSNHISELIKNKVI